MRRAAIRYADQGWPIVPGAVLRGDRYVCGPLCPTVSCHPALDRWETRASGDRSDVEAWWSTAPCAVLLATGHTVDVIEVPARVGAAAVRGRVLGPVAVVPTGRWMFLVSAGDGLRTELASQMDIVLHGAGSWVPAPPTPTPKGPVRWHTPPSAVGWRLPDSYAVQRELVAHVHGPRPLPTFATSSPRLSRAS